MFIAASVALNVKHNAEQETLVTCHHELGKTSHTQLLQMETQTHCRATYHTHSYST